MIKASDVTVVFRCCECGNETTRPLKGITILPSVCGECNKLENYIEPVGVLIDQVEQAALTEH
jgi:hypothetical protein